MVRGQIDRLILVIYFNIYIYAYEWKARSFLSDKSSDAADYAGTSPHYEGTIAISTTYEVTGSDRTGIMRLISLLRFISKGGGRLEAK